MRNAKLAAVLLLALTGGASAAFTEAECSALNGYLSCMAITGEPLTEAMCDTNYCVWDGSTCDYLPATLTNFSAISFSASQTAAEEACAAAAAAADCEGPKVNNTIFVLTADGTYMTHKPNVCKEEGASCGVDGLWVYSDECITNGYPFSSLQKPSAGNSVRPALAFALACVSAAVAAFA